jgi:hypothetical protein
MSNFRDWTLQHLNKRFGLKQLATHQALTSWLETEAVIDDVERNILARLSKKLILSIDSYNEQELIIKCIGGIISVVGLDGDNYSAFAERLLEATVDGEVLTGKPDLMLAAGTSEPEAPYFCLHEYKKSLENSGEPSGQCLAAMLAAQAKNPTEQVIYGCYVLGRQWLFMVLVGKQYAISNAYLVTRDDIFDIARILRALKYKVAAILNPVS